MNRYLYQTLLVHLFLDRHVPTRLITSTYTCKVQRESLSKIKYIDHFGKSFDWSLYSEYTSATKDR